ncbi:Uncharacterised protein [Mycobacteroides abscessus subsp. abscessus]|nr:Uncharacterised protein [Mycobacteroides abscessus subsp. abscessus]
MDLTGKRRLAMAGASNLGSYVGQHALLVCCIRHADSSSRIATKMRTRHAGKLFFSGLLDAA